MDWLKLGAVQAHAPPDRLMVPTLQSTQIRLPSAHQHGREIQGWGSRHLELGARPYERQDRSLCSSQRFGVEKDTLKGHPVTRSSRPVFLNLTQIRMPVGALTSIGHRVSGTLLAASTPVGVFLFDRSLQSEQGFADVLGLLGNGAVKLAMVLAVWALVHHVLAGVRHLLSDFGVGSPLRLARRSAWFVNLGGVAVALLAAGVLL